MASSRQRIEDRIKRKEAEIQELEMKIREERAYVQALHDTMKFLPRDDDVPVESILRTGSAVAEARGAILNAGRPLHISDILKAMGRPVDRKNTTGLSGSIAAYVRKGEIFNRPAPNTFGLVEMTQDQSGIEPAAAEEEPPPDFGSEDNPDIPF